MTQTNHFQQASPNRGRRGHRPGEGYSPFLASGQTPDCPVRGMRRHEARQLAQSVAADFPCGGVFPIALSLQSDGKVSKRPLTPHGHKDAESDPDAIRALFAEAYPLREGEEMAVGLYPGPSLLGVDVDELSALLTLEIEHGELSGLHIRTVSGGQHIYFTLPEGVTVGNRTPWSGIDIRSQNGWLVAPGSFCSWGSWTVESGEIVEAPPWLVEALTVEPEPASSPSRTGRGQTPPLQVWGDPIIKGNRNPALYSEARSMNRRGWSMEACYQALLIFNEHHCEPRHTDEKVAEACRSAYSRYDQGSDEPFKGVSAWD